MPQQYTVKSGDTLSAIGARHGVDWRQITGFKSGNPNLIYPGEVLTIPDKPGVTPPQTFQNTQQVQQHLNEVQNQTFETYKAPDEPKVQSLTQISDELKKTGLLPTATSPKTPNLVETYKTLAEEKGLAALEKDITDLKAQEDELAAQLRVNVAAERAKPVPQNVIEGRISEQERTARENLDFVQRKKARKLDEYNTAINSIRFMMDVTQKDYDNALQTYNATFQQAISIINLVRGIQNEQKDERQKQLDNARANLTVYLNLLKSGNLSYDSLPEDQKAMLNKLEVQSGLPLGLTSKIKADALSITEKDGQIQVLMRNPDGTLGLQVYGTATDIAGLDLGDKKSTWEIVGTKETPQSVDISTLWGE